MLLEKEIQQVRFKNQYHKLAVNLQFSHSWYIERQNKILKRFNISPQQFNILRILRGQYPVQVTIKLLKERMIDKMSDVSRIVEKLFVKELLMRELNLEDRRKVKIVITKKGLDLLDEMDKSEKELEDIMQNLSESEAENLNTLLDKMRG